MGRNQSKLGSECSPVYRLGIRFESLGWESRLLHHSLELNISIVAAKSLYCFGRVHSQLAFLLE